MSWITRLFGKQEPTTEQREITGNELPWISATNIFAPTITTHSALSIPAVYQAVCSVADMVSTLPLPVYKKTDGGGWEQDEGHRLTYLLNTAPNDYQTAKSWRFSMVVDLLAQGESLHEIERDGSGRPIALWRVEPTFLTTRWDSIPVETGGTSTTLRYYIAGRQVDPMDFLHIVSFSIDGFRGISPFSLCSDSIGLTVMMQRYGSSFFKNGARPGGILSSPPGLSPEDREDAKKNWNDAQSGPDRAGATAVLPPGFAYNPMSLAPEEAQYIEGRAQQMRECGRITRAVPHLYGDYERQTWANISYAGEELVRSLIDPMTDGIEQEMNRKLLSDYQSGTHYIEHDIRPLTAGSFADQVDTLTKACGRPILTVNEARERLCGLPPVDGGDELVSPVNMASDAEPADAPGEQPTDSPKAQQADGLAEEEVIPGGQDGNE